ncbi:MAG: ferrochelatase [Terriglobia bacterium]
MESSHQDNDEAPYDALLVVSFGGPERNEDVIPFLENVLRGRNVPRERMLDVAGHYYELGGRSPINDQNRALVGALENVLAEKGPALRVYWGNRNWHPLLADTVRSMKADGIRRALAFVTSAFSSYSSCRQYLENIADAQREAGANAPLVDKLRAFYNHPRFIEVWVESIREALERFPAASRESAEVVFSAHSIPACAAENCRYVGQLAESCRLISERLGRGPGTLVYQSRSGSPTQPWLGPDLNDYLTERASRGGRREIMVAPVGFVSDHTEVIYDLDVMAKHRCDELGLNIVRAATPGTHPEFVEMIRELILERTELGVERRALGEFGAEPDVCAEDCCLPATSQTCARQ